MMLTQGKPVTGMIQQENDDDDDTYSDIVFVQTRHVQVHKHKGSLLRDEAITMLKKKGKNLGSHILELAAMQLAADPFAKIKTLLQGLIERLLSESTDEATQKGWCDTEIGKANSDRDYRQSDCDSLSADIAVLEATKAEQEEKMAELKASISDLNDAHTEATRQRDD